jgi:hypothetical protein
VLNIKASLIRVPFGERIVELALAVSKNRLEGGFDGVSGEAIY